MTDQADTRDPETRVSIAAALAACAALAAAWLAAGSTGLWAEPLRTALTYLALGVAVVAGFPGRSTPRWLAAAVILMACLPLAVDVPPLYHLFLVAAVTGLLAAAADGPDRGAWTVCAVAILSLAVFRLACLSVPLIWVANDRVGAALGQLGGWIAAQPLRVGATFGGTNFLVLMVALVTAWLIVVERSRWQRGAIALCIILGGHLIYLVVLARFADLAELLPVAEDPTFDHPYTPPDWRWSPAVAQWLPWNLPILAAVIHLAIAAVLLRWTTWLAPADRPGVRSGGLYDAAGPWYRHAATAAPLVLAILLPVSATYCSARSDLTGKTIVVNARGQLNWDRPQYDRYGRQSAGLFGMLPLLVESLGGQLQQSEELSEADLAEADVLLLLHPVGPIAESVRQRVGDFVRRGGALLIVAEPYLRDGDRYSAASEFLQTAAITVRRDVALSETGAWQQAAELSPHPITGGVVTERSNYFSDAGCSLAVGWSARPLIVGRWGWSDPGSDAVLTGSYELEPGERLGDLVLAAEQPCGKGRIVVLGDDHSLTNEGAVHGYTLSGRLLAYLANRSGSPLSGTRQLSTALLSVVLLTLLLVNPVPQRLVVAALLLSVTLSISHAASRRATRVIPDGTIGNVTELGTRSNLAYIDSSHLEPYSDADWVFDGIDGLALTLMRNGFLTVAAPQVTSERLEKAAVFVSVAPARRFTDTERAAVRQFVEGGGIFICTVGAEEASASAPLLADFGLRVPPSPVPTVGREREPEPIGRIRSLFLDARDYGEGDYKAGVRFYAAWPVEFRGGNADVLVRAGDNRPIVVSRRVGRGYAVVIGDTGFALNKNLEYIGGEPFEGGYENAHFWRWLISRLTDRTEWIPPPAPPATDATTPAEESLPPADVLPAIDDLSPTDQLPPVDQLPRVDTLPGGDELPILDSLPAGDDALPAPDSSLDAGREDPS